MMDGLDWDEYQELSSGDQSAVLVTHDRDKPDLIALVSVAWSHDGHLYGVDEVMLSTQDHRRLVEVMAFLSWEDVNA